MVTLGLGSMLVGGSLDQTSRRRVLLGAATSLAGLSILAFWCDQWLNEQLLLGWYLHGVIPQIIRLVAFSYYWSKDMANASTKQREPLMDDFV